tara:strand:+ start:704 stop:871 length:168 start_codon:yes stop_codon:yes gene_type:complete
MKNKIINFEMKLRKVGNSHVITIPSDFVERFELDNGDFLVIEVNGKKIKQNLKNE